MLRLTLEGELENGLDFQNCYHEALNDERRRSNANPNDVANYNGSGRVQNYDDTYWLSYDAKFESVSLVMKISVPYLGFAISLYEYNVRENNEANY